MGFGIRYATSSPYWQYYYFGKNIQGDVIALYRSDYNSSSQSYYPTLVATYSYDPWGTPTGIYDANGNAISQTAYNVAAYNPFRYRGYRYDGDTRLYYLQSRYYDPAIGRFINADSPNFALTNPYSDGITDKNYFAYCDNDPVNRSDNGGKFWNIVVGAVVGGLASAVATAYTSYKETGKVDWASTGISAATGALNGGIAASGMGVIGQAVASGAVSAAGSAVSSVRSGESAGKIIAKAAISGVVGLASSVAGSAVGKLFTGKMQQAGELLVRKGKLGRSTFTRAASKQLVRQGKKYINLGRGISSVLGTASTWRTNTVISYVLSKW